MRDTEQNDKRPVSSTFQRNLIWPLPTFTNISRKVTLGQNFPLLQRLQSLNKPNKKKEKEKKKRENKKYGDREIDIRLH